MEADHPLALVVSSTSQSSNAFSCTFLRIRTYKYNRHLHDATSSENTVKSSQHKYYSMRFLVSLTALAAIVAAAPHPVAVEAKDLTPTKTQPLEKRATTVCGQWDSVETGTYTIYNNLWGRDSGTGSQCLTVDGITSNLVKWSTSWSWSGGPYNVKSYPNAVLKAPAARVSAVSTIPSKWQWRYVPAEPEPFFHNLSPAKGRIDLNYLTLATAMKQLHRIRNSGQCSLRSLHQQ